MHLRLLAQAAGLSEFEQSAVEYASLFHDLGKMGIPDAILLKPGRLTEEEEAIMRAHKPDKEMSRPRRKARRERSKIHVRPWR